MFLVVSIVLSMVFLVVCVVVWLSGLIRLFLRKGSVLMFVLCCSFVGF